MAGLSRAMVISRRQVCYSDVSMYTWYVRACTVIRSEDLTIVGVQLSLARLDMRVDWCGVDDVEDGLAEECTSAFIPTSRLGADITLMSNSHILL